MITLRSVLAAPIVLVVLGSAALAGEKTFVLKSGTRIKGELVDERPDSYTVKAGGGKLVILKAQVVRTEDVAPPAPAPAPLVAVPATRTPDVTARLAGRSEPDAPLASDDEVARAREVVRVVAVALKTGAADQEGLSARISALPAASLAALLADPGDLGEELSLAVRPLTRDRATGRRLLARAVKSIDGEKAPHRALLEALKAVADDADPAIDQAITARLRRRPGANEPAVLKIAGRIGTLRVLPALVEGLVAADVASGAMAVHSQAANQVLARATDQAAVDRALLQIAPTLSATDMTTENAEQLLSLFVFGHDPKIAAAVLASIERADGTADGADDRANERVVSFLTAGYRALLVVRTDTSVRRVLAGGSLSAPASHRTAALSVLLDLRISPDAIRARAAGGEGAEGNRKPVAAADPVRHEILDRLACYLEEPSRPDAERKQVAQVLQELTGQLLGDNATAWHRYLMDR